jgi:uncharacterized protein YndB with AHSA1/START domain
LADSAEFCRCGDALTDGVATLTKEDEMDTHWQGSIDIAAPPERVFTYLADFPRHCEWAQTLERMEQTRPGSVGARYKTFERQAMQADRPPRGPMPAKAFKGTTECEVTELTPNERIAWRAHPVPIGMGIHAELAFDIVPDGNGGTTLAQTIQMHEPWLASQLFSRLMRMNPATMEVKARAQWEASLRNIKAILEEPDASKAKASQPNA